MSFLSTPSARRATTVFIIHPLSAKIFLSTPSARRATSYLNKSSRPLEISIHALREEGDFSHFDAPFFQTDFYPRPPRGGRQKVNNIPVGVTIFLSTPSARRATRGETTQHQLRPISIHALREEGDKSFKLVIIFIKIHFYPRPPRGGRLYVSFRAGLLF